MSVYTKVNSTQLDNFLQRYVLGKALALRPIAAGITNTNYYLETDAGEFVLTLYEHHSDDELDYILGLQRHLAARSVHCANPVLDRRDSLYSTLNQRPAAIIHRVPGEVISSPRPEHCSMIGAELARFHLAGQDFAANRPNPRGYDWITAVQDMLNEVLDVEDHRLIDDCLQDYRKTNPDSLPRGAIHADLFHDNALFDHSQLGGIIDFDYACDDVLVLDIAIMLNDWCIDDQGELNPGLVEAVLGAYAQIRPLSETEIDVLPLFLRIAALRFWLSRLYDKTFPLSGELTTIKCPDEFRRLLLQRNDNPESLASLFLPHRGG